MSEELKPCPFCGNLLEIVHKNGSKYVRCISGTCIFETARHGYHISDDKLIKRCNRRPAEDALTAEIERLKAENEKCKRVLSGICFEKSARICKYAPESCKVCKIKEALNNA